MAKNEDTTAKQKKIGIILQAAILFIIGIFITSVLTYATQRVLSDGDVTAQVEEKAESVSADVRQSLKEFQAYKWLLSYWYEHADELDIDYDSKFVPGTRTEYKCSLFSARHPGLQLRYLNTAQVVSLPKEDQKLYAEIAYSWFITRLDEIKAAYDVDYLFGVIADETFTHQYFLFSAADEGAVRGTEYMQVYPIGVETSVEDNPSLQSAMREAVRNVGHLADAGEFVDYYDFLAMVGDKPLLTGITYNLSDLRATIEGRTKLGTLNAMIIQLILLGICLLLLYHIVLKPLKKVQNSIRSYQETKDSETVKADLDQIRSRNEIGILANDVKGLASELDEHILYVEKIAAERERIGAELSLASRIQSSLLPAEFPAFPSRTEFDIFASMTPAREVGGDFYDFFMPDEDHLAFVIADVSGKGVPAALFMLISMTLIHNIMMREKDPAKVLEAVNEQICERNKEEMFVTVWLGNLDLKTGKLTAANAGHEYPVIRDPEGNFELLKDKHDFLIGGFSGMPYHNYEIDLKPGSRIFVYTDGVPEASNKEHELFGTDRMVEALRGVQDETPEGILEGVRKAVKDFEDGAEQYDDLTMLCVYYKG